MNVRERALRIAYFAAAPLISLIVFHRVFTTWFQNDDFGWMAIRDRYLEDGLLVALFHPFAQGTVRVLSERVPFLVFPALFGLNPLPSRILAFATWIVALTLAALIGHRLTGSRWAGLIAAVLWGVNGALVRPLAWSSNYNEVLCAACILLAFYAHLRGWILAEWAAFLAALGSLEIAVLYPVASSLHAFLFDRKKLRSALPLFIPAAIYAAIHTFLIPKTGGADYQIAIDGRIATTLVEYLKWVSGGPQLFQFVGHWNRSGNLAALLIGAAVVIFAVWRTLRRDFLPLLCCAWFFLFLGPMLLLPNHFIEYAITTPLAGFSWLAAWGIVESWRIGWWTRAAAVSLAALYLVTTAFEADQYSIWWRDRSRRIEAVVDGVRAGQLAHPGAAFILQGIDLDVFNTGFVDDPFHLIGATVYLAPGAEQYIPLNVDAADRRRWMISPQGASMMLERGEARVLTLTGTTMRDTTNIYQAVLRLNPAASRRDFVNVADPNFAKQIGSGWYPLEANLRWMSKSATVKLSGPESASQKLRVTGFAPPLLLAGGPVTLSFSAAAIEIGKGTVSKPEAFSLEFAVPASLIGQPEIELKIEASRTLRPPGDMRDLGMAFGTFAIR